ncbi:TetR/AcrR family transcriptional regulator [Serratia odorifera]|jgi:TetR/AcrR family transcriptional regulator, copper-responsive repressor|uniref:Transcriptional regulator, TetR family n=2 Tax=Serratia odorifera TaxID=618 RepID=D4E985_SEROD|nr:TetR/AcrR family transcriptional regulator [Serratia odorifera]EFE93851.1 transcriptional regulator, TetR family [Serratia odorifera DSM 4582]MBJ2064195.1 TetR/AcrR family transcriptional regulator [Serratia odorifera]PNK88551.1 TetR/AcrR family transcriptional regulator [Serratia odorifera]RII69654.1 TetR/AcrR family transcriptional regulator [Serratia odorifera]VDZ65562.1 DNA-binding transcriptional repressor AcrR [Serratia odorifera]
MTIKEEVCAKKTRGRPKQFDRDQALDRALDLFWRHGYESTSLADLVEVTGAKAPTLYAEFGNKEGLFRAAVERYLSKYTTCTNQLLEQTLPIAEVVEAYVRSSAEVFTDPQTPSGCFMVCASAALSPASDDVAEMLRRKHHTQEASLKACFDRKVQQGELLAKTDTALLAKYIMCTIEGMSVQAREGASRDDLLRLVETLMMIWPRLSQVGNKV